MARRRRPGDLRRDRLLPRPPRRGPRRRRPDRAPPTLRQGAALRAARRAAVALEIDPLVEALLAVAALQRVRRRPPGARVRARARPAAGRGQQLGRVAGGRAPESSGSSRCSTRRDLGRGGSAQARAGHLRAGAAARRRAGREAVHVGRQPRRGRRGRAGGGIEPVLIRRGDGPPVPGVGRSPAWPRADGPAALCGDGRPPILGSSPPRPRSGRCRPTRAAAGEPPSPAPVTSGRRGPLWTAPAASVLGLVVGVARDSFVVDGVGAAGGSSLSHPLAAVNIISDVVFDLGFVAAACTSRVARRRAPGGLRLPP